MIRIDRYIITLKRQQHLLKQFWSQMFALKGQFFFVGGERDINKQRRDTFIIIDHVNEGIVDVGVTTENKCLIVFLYFVTTSRNRMLCFDDRNLYIIDMKCFSILYWYKLQSFFIAVFQCNILKIRPDIPIENMFLKFMDTLTQCIHF